MLERYVKLVAISSIDSSKESKVTQSKFARLADGQMANDRSLEFAAIASERSDCVGLRKSMFCWNGNDGEFYFELGI